MVKLSTLLLLLRCFCAMTRWHECFFLSRLCALRCCRQLLLLPLLLLLLLLLLPLLLLLSEQ